VTRSPQNPRPQNPRVASISAFFPCYNDEATIETVARAALAAIDRVGADGEVIVVNDGSTDASARVLDELARAEPRVRVITHEQNRGYGGALISGFEAATKDWVFYTDGDGQFDPSELELLVEHAGDGVDVVQGFKMDRADNLARRFIGRAYHHVASLAFALQIRDTDCDFRLMRRDVLARIELTRTTGVICVELVRKLQDAGAQFVEVGVHHYPRQHGRSEFFRPARVFRTLVDMGRLWWEIVPRRGRSRSGTGGEHDR
jgi:glycosyltransferase involved in cell wall biosynthesis